MVNIREVNMSISIFMILPTHWLLIMTNSICNLIKNMVNSAKRLGHQPCSGYAGGRYCLAFLQMLQMWLFHLRSLFTVSLNVLHNSYTYSTCSSIIIANLTSETVSYNCKCWWMVVMPVVLLLTTVVRTMHGFLLWLVISTGHVLKTVAALLVLLVERLQHVNVSVKINVLFYINTGPFICYSFTYGQWWSTSGTFFVSYLWATHSCSVTASIGPMW